MCLGLLVPGFGRPVGRIEGAVRQDACVSAPEDELSIEQRVVTSLYERLDATRAKVRGTLATLRNSPTAGTPAARAEREGLLSSYLERLSALESAEDRLAFGRLDTSSGSTYIGRLGLSDDDNVSLLVDWRAPVAEPFYRATAAVPQGVIRRRHIVTAGRSVTSVEDDVLDIEAASAGGTVVGGGALMAALGARRTGRMRDIVATIQSEQDRIIRADLAGVLVVEGGPGAGKTVVALHRAAYLLYTHRERLARRGVLVIGPNPLFLRYIEQVLPALGETAVVLMTPGSLFPGIETDRVEASERAAEIKGSARMARVLQNAVRDRQRALPEAVKLVIDSGAEVTLTPAMVTAAMDRARSSKLPHNKARRVFALDILDKLAAQYARTLRVADDDLRDALIGDLRASKDVRREINLCWMPLTPQRLLTDLYARPDLLEKATPRFTPAERSVLQRDRGEPWTVSDIPLLDELAELLGEDEESNLAEAARAAADRKAELDYAREVAASSGGGMVTAEQIVDRYAADTVLAPLAERAVSDRTWTYGHAVIDEAQELSPMAWRAVLRRVPTRSMTVVGDLDQTGSSAGVSSWDEVFEREAKGRWAVERLTVSYRTPQPLLDVATNVLRASTGREPTVTTAARDGEPPLIIQISAESLSDKLIETVRDDAAKLDGGRLAVLVAAPSAASITALLVESLGEDLVGQGVGTLDKSVSVLTVGAAKGLEFDSVVLVEPSDFLSASPRGGHDLYVALTRATNRLTVVHSKALPAGF